MIVIVDYQLTRWFKFKHVSANRDTYITLREPA